MIDQHHHATLTPSLIHMHATIPPLKSMYTSSGHRHRQQRPEIRHPQPRSRIPPFRRIPACIRDDATTLHRLASLSIDTCAAYTTSASDIRQAFDAGVVEKRVQEAEGFKAFG